MNLFDPVRAQRDYDNREPSDEESGGIWDEQFLIWSFEHEMWWKPDRQGYTRIVDEAGRYYGAEVLRICVTAIPYGIEIPVDVIDAQRHGTNYIRNKGRIEE